MTPSGIQEQVSKKQQQEVGTVLYISVNVWLQKISMPPPQRVIGNSEGEGDLKAQNFLGNV